MSKKMRKFLSYTVLLVTIFGLVIIDLGRTFAYFVINGEIITSSFSGHYSFNGNYVVNSTPFSNEESDKTSVSIETGNFRINNSTIDKTGDSTVSAMDGSNAAVKVHSGATLELFLDGINTNATYSPGVYADGGKVTITGSTITTVSSYSSGMVAANGGTVISNYSKVETAGENSSAIFADSSGKVNVFGGTFKTNAINSPVVLAKGDVSIGNGASLTSLQSDGIVVDGNHSVSFNDSSLNVSGENYKGINLYQSGSRDDSSSVLFSAANSSVTTNKGDAFYITNTKAVINLNNNTISSNSGNFMKVEASQFGNNGANGGDVVLNMIRQNANGNVIVDDLSKLQMDLSDGSVFQGAINSDNNDGIVSLKMSQDSQLVLTGDTYLTSLEDADTTYSNINFNGHDLYVNGEKIVVSTSGGSSGESGQGGNETGTGTGTGSGDGTGTTNGTESGDGQNNNKQDNNKSSGSTNSGSSSNQKDGKGTGTGSGSGTGNGNSKSSTDGTVSSGSSLDSSKGDINNKEDDVTFGDDEIITDSTIGKNKVIKKGPASSIYDIDSKTLVIINVIGILLIVTSVISLIRLHKEKDVLE